MQNDNKHSFFLSVVFESHRGCFLFVAFHCSRVASLCVFVLCLHASVVIFAPPCAHFVFLCRCVASLRIGSGLSRLIFHLVVVVLLLCVVACVSLCLCFASLLCFAWVCGCFVSLCSCVTFQLETLAVISNRGSGTGAPRPHGPLGLSPVGLFSSPFMETNGLNHWEGSKVFFLGKNRTSNWTRAEQSEQVR